MEKDGSEKLLEQIRNCTNLIHRLMHSEHHAFHSAPQTEGIGRGQGLVLRILAEEDGLAQSEITEKLDIRPSSLGELVTKLERNGYVERRQNENDKRVINVFLTEKGRETEKLFVNPRREAAKSWCDGLSEEEKAQLSALLDKLIASMEASLSKSGNSDPEPGFGSPDNFPRHGPHFPHDHSGKHCCGDREARRRKLAEQFWHDSFLFN